MRKLFFALLTLLVLILAALDFYGQAPFRLQARCAAPNQRVSGTITVTASGIRHVPCPTTSNFFTDDVRIGTQITPFWSGANPFGLLQVGYGETQSLIAGQGFTGAEFNFPLNLNSISGVLQGQAIALNLTGALTGGAVRAQSIDIFSNGASGTGELVGTDVNVDVGGAWTSVYGGRFTALAGNASATVGSFYGVQGVALAIHHNSATNAFGGDFAVSSAAGAPNTLTLGAAVNARALIRSGATFTSISGLRVADWQLVGTAGTSYGIFIDSSIDVGSTARWAFYSTSISPSLFSGVVRVAQDVYVTDNTKGIVLTSPDGTCYRYTAANGGALNAGVAIACP